MSCSDSFIRMHSPGACESLRLWLQKEMEVDMGKCCRLVDTPCNYTWTTRAYGHLEHTRPGGLFMITAALRICPGAAIAEIHADQNVISGSQVPQKLSSHHLRKKENKT